MKVDVLGVKIDNVTMEEAVKEVLSAVGGSSSFSVFTPNAEMVAEAYRDKSLQPVINSASLVVPDGSGVILGARFLGKRIKEKVAGVDIVQNILASGEKLSLFIYGGRPGVAQKAAEKIESRYGNITVCGTEHGYHKEEENETIAELINSLSPDVVLVGLGVPRQERWIYENSGRTGGAVLIGCGGTIDILSGESRRAPSFFIRMNLEWLYRLLKEPSRISRMMRIPVFLLQCLKRRFSG